MKDYSDNINDNDRQKIEDQLLEVVKLNDEYIKGALGGIERLIIVKINSRNKNIRINNTSVDEIDELFRIINNILPDGMPKLLIL